MGPCCIILVALAFTWVTWASSAPQVPCLFIFGDSLVDNGNNNGMLTLARANYMPYGVDFPQGVTGRFNNGMTTVDVLALLLGFPDFIPPYADTRGPALLRGANYASGAAGIRDETGNNLGEHVSMNQQVGNFGETVVEMRRMFGGNISGVNEYLSKCIFHVGMGSNDYLNNYFMPDMYSTSYRYSPGDFANLLLRDYTRQLIELYNLGARKVALTTVGQIGCIPYELARQNGNGNGSRCVGKINEAIMMFNSGLQKLVDRFNSKLPGAKFIFVNSYKTFQLLAMKPVYYGFSVIDKGCCGVGKNNGQITCLPLEQPCTDRSKYLFWDAFHPTEAANIIIAKKAYGSKLCSDVYPMNIKQLAML